MAIHQYSRQARTRIARSVMKTERDQGIDPQSKRRPRAVGSAQPTLMIAQAAIEHGQFGTARIASANTWDSNYADGGFGDQEVFNPGPKVWAGSVMLCERASLAKATTGDGLRWVVVDAWSATRIAGKAAAAISEGATGTVNTVQGLDGPYPGTSVSATVPSGFSEVQSGRGVSADLVFNPGTLQSEWIITSADRNPTTGGGGTSVQWMTTNFRSSVLITPDTTVQATESKVIDFTHAVTDGSVSGVTFDGVNKWTFDTPGTYLVMWNASCDASDPTEVYSPGEEFTDNLKVGSARLYLVNGAGSQIAEQGGYVTVSKPDEMTQTVTDQHRLVFESADSIQLKITHENTLTADNAGVRVFHAKMHILKF